MNPTVDFYFSKATKWREELEQLRKIVLGPGTGLTEELKWGVPCYTLRARPGSLPAGRQGRQESNIVLIHVFKEYCALLFFQGVLLKDPHGILVQQTKNVQTARQVRFTNTRQIVKMKPILEACIQEAIEVEKAGLKVQLKKTSAFKIPGEFQKKLDEIPALKTAFHALTPGRQRGYNLFFSAPKQSKTRESRVEKWIQPILRGKGLNDQ